MSFGSEGKNMVQENKIVQEYSSADLSALFKAIATVRGEDPLTAQWAVPDASAFPIRREFLAAQARAAEEKRAGLLDLNTGDAAPDGSIYIGKVYGKHWFATASTATDPSTGNHLQFDYNDAVTYAKNLNVHGHDDWVLPNRDEWGMEDILGVMWMVQDRGCFKGTYNDSAGNAEWYWSKLERDGDQRGYAREFHSCHLDSIYEKRKIDRASVRCVRFEPGHS